MSEEVTEVVEASAEAVEVIYKTSPALLVGVALISASAGVGITYFILNKRLKTKYEKIADAEIQEAKAFYRKPSLDDLANYAKEENEAEVEEDDDKEEASNFVEAASEIIESQNYQSYSSIPQTDTAKVEVSESIQKNIFDTATNDDGGFDLDDELDKKRAGKPYILEAEEFFENESQYSQMSFTYFEGDDVLADEQDHIVNNYMQIIGGDNLKFGYGSKDTHMVYIRNDKLEAEYEIARSQGKYSEEVAGFIEHSDKPRLRKFRKDDD